MEKIYRQSAAAHVIAEVVFVTALPITEPPISAEDQYAEWLQARIGKCTASNLWKIAKQTKAGPSAYRRSYMVELIAEKLTGQSADTYMSQSMQWGIETEPKARAAYEARTSEIVETVGFVDHPIIPSAGCSPDGLVGDDGLIEIKCPETRTHIGYMLDRSILDDKYIIQMQWQMACNPGRKWVDFVSFDPRLPLSCQFFKVRIMRDDKLIKGLEKLVIEFLDEMRRYMEIIEGSAHLESSDV